MRYVVGMPSIDTSGGSSSESSHTAPRGSGRRRMFVNASPARTPLRCARIVARGMNGAPLTAACHAEARATAARQAQMATSQCVSRSPPARAAGCAVAGRVPRGKPSGAVRTSRTSRVFHASSPRGGRSTSRRKWRTLIVAVGVWMAMLGSRPNGLSGSSTRSPVLSSIGSSRNASHSVHTCSTRSGPSSSLLSSLSATFLTGAVPWSSS
mmetsp:Transcript_8735/g.20957  ORF Transcript_8735/g.20957 Transcript_8735/m.20957 type:complete len:210 (-) Transcript_8735:23-652(-)